MRSLLAGVALLLTAVAFAAQDRPARGPAQASKGRLLAVGGGGTTDEIVARAIELAGGPEKRMLIVPQASGAEDAGAGSLEFWQKHVKDVRILELGDREKALAAIREADFVWMPGGDQSRLMKALLDADLVAAIRERYHAGALVGGTSAGAAVLSSTMIVGGETADLKSVRGAGTLTAEGLGLWPGAVVDQHFVQRQRFNRLLSCVLDLPQLVGVGVDEKTAVILHPDGACEVLGDGVVVVVDARRATRRPAKAGELHSADGLTLSVLRAGDRFSLALPDQR